MQKRINMNIRRYCPSDCAQMAQLFTDTVHTVNARDYTPQQLQVWAPAHLDLDQWNTSFLQHNTWVAEVNGTIVGFGDMAENGYLDRLYVHKDFQRQGIASALCDVLEQSVPGKVTTHASITARPFFEKRGYRVIREQTVMRSGIALTNFVMEKQHNRDKGALEL